MPQLGETVTEGTIVRWVKKVGDQVAEDEVLFEVSTDKVDSEVPSPASGYLTEILVQEGETVDVGARLAVIGDGADGDAAAPPPQAKAGTAVDAPAPESAPASGDEPEPEPEPAPEPEAGSPPAAAAEGAAGPAPATTRPAPAAGPGKVLSPVVRRLVAEHALDPQDIEGSGAGGRVTRADVLAVIDARKEGSEPAAAPSRAPAP
ncbi:MAG: biotin/lipoyl-containing protein, partial [Acidimicrobiales bacterium]